MKSRNLRPGPYFLRPREMQNATLYVDVAAVRTRVSICRPRVLRFFYAPLLSPGRANASFFMRSSTLKVSGRFDPGVELPYTSAADTPLFTFRFLFDRELPCRSVVRRAELGDVVRFSIKTLRSRKGVLRRLNLTLSARLRLVSYRQKRGFTTAIISIIVFSVFYRVEVKRERERTR